MVIQRACTGALRAALLIVHGGSEPREYEITWDATFEATVWERIAWFWDLVESMKEPHPIPPAKPAVPAVRIVDMRESNQWALYADAWLTNQGAARVFNNATRLLKGLVEADVAKAHGHGIAAVRDRAGRLSIKEA
jgi:hypothetical protein